MNLSRSEHRRTDCQKSQSRASKRVREEPSSLQSRPLAQSEEASAEHGKERNGDRKKEVGKQATEGHRIREEHPEAEDSSKGEEL